MDYAIAVLNEEYEKLECEQRLLERKIIGNDIPLDDPDNTGIFAQIDEVIRNKMQIRRVIIVLRRASR